MGFMEAVKSCFRRYVDFQGRSPRSEYWWFTLFNIIVILVLAGASGIIPILGIALLIYYLAMILPALAVTIRRFHDLDKSGWFILIQLIPIVGPFIILYWFCLKGTDGDNRFGPDPLGNVAERFD